MSAPQAHHILRIPGRLVKNPTNMSSDYPYGGTELGVIRDIEWSPGIQAEKLHAEEFGLAVGSIITRQEGVMAAVLRSWDNDFLSTVFPNTQADEFGEVGVLGRVSGSGVNRVGYDEFDKGFKLLFAPFAANQHRFLLLHNAVPMIEDTFRLRLTLADEFGLPVIFYAAADSQGRTFTWDVKENLVL